MAILIQISNYLNKLVVEFQNTFISIAQVVFCHSESCLFFNSLVYSLLDDHWNNVFQDLSIEKPKDLLLEYFGILLVLDPEEIIYPVMLDEIIYILKLYRINSIKFKIIFLTLMILYVLFILVTSEIYTIQKRQI